MNLPRPTELAKQMVATVLGMGDTAIDATIGNGHDTLFLAEAVGPGGRVLGFDVQQAAIDSTSSRIKYAGCHEQVELFLQSHSAMAEHAAEGSVSAVMFNLGYLPGAEHAVATGEDTLKALESAALLIRDGGVLSVVCYPGHEGGDGESQQVENWMAALPERGWRVIRYGAIGTRRPAPYLLFAARGRA